MKNSREPTLAIPRQIPQVMHCNFTSECSVREFETTANWCRNDWDAKCETNGSREIIACSSKMSSSGITGAKFWCRCWFKVVFIKCKTNI